jgi:hypothetical protein
MSHTKDTNALILSPSKDEGLACAYLELILRRAQDEDYLSNHHV